MRKSLSEESKKKFAAYRKEWEAKNRARRNAWRRGWRAANKERLASRARALRARPEARAKQQSYYQKNKGRLLAQHYAWNAKNMDKKRAYRRKYARLNPGKEAEGTARWRRDNPEKVLQQKQRLAAKRKLPEVKAARAAKVRERHRSDARFRIERNLRSRIGEALKAVGAKKAVRLGVLLGCSLGGLKRHLEAQFRPGMSWENHGRGPGKWHIDHIRPCASFDLLQREEQRRCFHYTNLQPLWEEENLRKGSRWAA